MRIFSFIFARGGSKGLPKKNVKKLNGKPLIVYSLQISKNIKKIEKCFVSTDSIEISNIASRYNAHVINRPIKLSSDFSPEWKAWQHAIKYCIKKYGKFDVFISLPATSPFKKVSDIKKCIKLLDHNTDVVITMSQSQRNPWFNMVQSKANNFLKLVNKKTRRISRRQDAPEVFDISTICYVAKPDFILKNNSFWDGRVKGLEIPFERSIDIDTGFDFKLANLLLKDKRG
jgi:N,N'-diacetyl-8-epilegionaminate cytidylyltransferase